MSESKWTPGPWSQSYTSDKGYGWDIYSGNTWVAAVNNDHGGNKHFPDNKSGQANADLIEASPDLYECLDMAQEAYCRQNCSDTLYDDIHLEPCVKMTETLAKARGES